MFVEVQQALIELLTAETGSDGMLAGVKSVRFSGEDVPTSAYPALTVDFGDDSEQLANGNHVQLSASYILTLYVNVLGGEAKNDIILQDLLMRFDTRLNKWRGILPALYKIRGIEVGARCYTIRVDPQIDRGIIESQKHQRATMAAQIKLRATIKVLQSEFVG